MPFCPKCGEEITPGATFCYYCGELLPKKQTPQETKSIPTSQPVTTPQPAPALPPKPMPEELPLPTSNRSRNIAIAIALIVIVVLVSVVAYAFVTGFIGVATTQTTQQGSMMMQSGQVFQNNPDYISVTVMNTGTKTLVLTSAFVDNSLIPSAQVTFSNPTMAPSATCMVTITATTGINWANGASHTVKIVASDGTPVAFSVHYSGSQPQGSMAIPIYQVFQNNPDGIIFNVTNTGTKNLTIGAAYIDGSQVSRLIGNLTLPIGNTNILAVAPQTNQNIVDGAAHTLKVVASDGTFVTISVVYNTLPQQGALSIDSASVTSSGITVYVRNTGSKTETLTSAYVDNALIVSGSVSFTPSATIAANQVCTVVIAGNGWADGAAHTVKIVASDGTPVAYSVHS